MKVKQVSVMVDLSPLLMNISLMVFIDTAILLENLSCVFKHYYACITLHATCRYSLVESHNYVSWLRGVTVGALHTVEGHLAVCRTVRVYGCEERSGSIHNVRCTWWYVGQSECSGWPYLEWCLLTLLFL